MVTIEELQHEKDVNERSAAKWRAKGNAFMADRNERRARECQEDIDQLRATETREVREAQEREHSEYLIKRLALEFSAVAKPGECVVIESRKTLTDDAWENLVTTLRAAKDESGVNFLVLDESFRVVRLDTRRTE